MLVHGLDGSWRNFLETMPHFARGRRVIALDLPGFGKSPMPDWEISIPAYARLLGAALRGARAGVRAVVVGNSMGGLIAVELGLSQPDLVTRLASISPVGISNATIEMEAAERVARALALLAPLSFRLREASLRRSRLRDAAFGNIFATSGELRAELLWEHYLGALGDAGKAISPPASCPRYGRSPATTSAIG